MENFTPFTRKFQPVTTPRQDAVDRVEAVYIAQTLAARRANHYYYYYYYYDH